MNESLALAMIFDGEPDRNMAFDNWPGTLPRTGDHLVLHGRDTKYEVAEVVWVLEPELREKTLKRGVRLHVRRVG